MANRYEKYKCNKVNHNAQPTVKCTPCNTGMPDSLLVNDNDIKSILWTI